MRKFWEQWEIGQRIYVNINEFDGELKSIGVVTEIQDDHAIVKCDGMMLWVDEDNEEYYTSVGDATASIIERF